MDPLTTDAKDDTSGLLVTEQVELRAFAEAVLCVRVHRKDHPSAAASIVVIQQSIFLPEHDGGGGP